MSSALTGRTRSSSSTRSFAPSFAMDYDFGLKKGLEHLDAVREKFLAITDRFADSMPSG
jgi:hypothetical protein